jgi:hypothetical protein
MSLASCTVCERSALLGVGTIQGVEKMKHFTMLVYSLFWLCLTAWAQSANESQISGSVLDSSGAAVTTATVTVTNEGTGAIRTATVNAEGNYVVTNLPVGTYTVTATAQGFKKFVSQGAALNVGSKLAVNATLQVGEVSETVEVQAQALQVETTTGEVGHLVTGAEATLLQLNGRNFIQLVSLSPGVSTTYTSSFRLYGPFGVVGAAQSINGTRPDSASFLVDGVDNKDPGGPSSNSYTNVSPDFIAEFKTVAASQSAQYGLNAGGTITMALKSGTKDFHGSAYEYFRNDAIQARSFNSPSKIPPLRYNNFGGTLGGPLFIPKVFNADKDKAFFFVGADLKRLRSAVITPWTVPSVAQRSGGSSATGQALVNLYPLPSPAGTCTGGNFCFANPGPVDVNEYIVKGDYYINPRNQITAHYIHDDNTLLGGTTNAYLFDRTIPGLNTGIQWTSIINPTTVNIATVSFSGNRITEKQGIRGNPNLGFTTAASLLRSTYGLNYPTLFNVDPSIPTVQITGFTALTVTPLAFDNSTRTYTAKDDFSKVIGNHNLKTGIVVQRGRKNQDSIPAINGTFNFTSIANAQAGNFNTYTEGNLLTQAWARFTNVEPYFQDDWKVSKRLTLNLGLRWAYIQPVFLALYNGTNFVPALFDRSKAAVVSPTTGFITSSPGSYDPYNGLALPGSSFPQHAQGLVPDSILKNPAVLALFKNQPQGFTNTDYGTWSPRFAFAYDLTGKQSTVLRGGFGETYERIRTTAANAMTSNIPFSTALTLRSGNASNPAGASAPNAPVTIGRALDVNLKNPQVLNWTLGIQQSIGSAAVFEIYYAGSRGNNLTYIKDINQLPVGTLVPGSPNANSLRPFPGYSDILLLTNGGVWNYNSLQMQFQKRFNGGGNLRVAYTWSKNLTDDYDGFYQPMDSYNIGRDYGPAPFNKPQVLTVSYSYPLPFWQKGSQWYQKALGGWALTGITSYSSGAPLNVYVTNDVAGTGINPGAAITVDGANPGGNVQRPDVIGDPYANTNRIQWLNPAAFAAPPPLAGGTTFAGRFGNAGAFAFKGPRINNWDITASKNFHFTEHVNLELRAECFNFLNHLSYTSVSTAIGTANFGQVNGATDPRTFEFALRLGF